MTSYLVRVELHGASYLDYVNLHGAMAAEGFARTIRADDGTTHQLPTAEYVINTYLTGDQVRTKADSAASTTGRAHAILVVSFVRAWWLGLPATHAA